LARPTEIIGTPGRRRILEVLTVHTYLENKSMYPEVRNPGQPGAVRKAVDAVLA
jgi:hypothetical protein